MNDRELLELAARAAGVGYTWSEFWETMARPLNDGSGWDNRATWNPLTDDGDALRLAVSTDLHKRLHEILTGPAYRADALWYGEQCATRRAITRAAAEIGKYMGGGE
ncbi:hypothetical protein Q041_02508 [Pseudomonas aeruginosa BWHPSA028]|uniref:hypothetical protein n=1 Tax=Pseudomonas aeruginosa TaxID=287 RepID=UPI0003B999FC|nr:hypothetical protein [Pseudomonas aeruginosa]ERV86751.1 hypothetical protein Q041_02508 [Pseudomonas aeruginosa BWHPSA028]